MAKFCTHCGAQLDPNMKFCAECGAPIEAAGEATPGQPSVAPAAGSQMPMNVPQPGNAYGAGAQPGPGSTGRPDMGNSNMLEPRSVALAIIFTIITCGIYGIYWIVKLTNETHQVAGRQTTSSGGMVVVFSFITCGIYALYWFYKMGETIDMAKAQRGLAHDNNTGVLYLILGVLALGIVSEALLQSSLNDIIKYDKGLA